MSEKSITNASPSDDQPDVVPQTKKGELPKGGKERPPKHGWLSW